MPVKRRKSPRTAQRVEVRSRAELRAWLSTHQNQLQSIWLVTYKKGSPHHLPYSAIVEEALCFGWIDSLPRALDTKRTMLRLSPRNPKSSWSEINRKRVQMLSRAGLMAESGLKAVREAKRSGAWAMLKAVSGNRLTPDLKRALTQNAAASINFKAFPPSTKRAILEWITQAKTPATRDKRVRLTVSLAAKGIRANQWRRGQSQG